MLQNQLRITREPESRAMPKPAWPAKTIVANNYICGESDLRVDHLCIIVIYEVNWQIIN